MTRNRTPQTQEKRRRERDKQVRHQEKLARRHERKAARREAKRMGTGTPAPSSQQTPDTGPVVPVVTEAPVEVESKP